jgi:hypothetical protein
MANFDPKIHRDEDYWPCACVKRDRDGNPRKVRLNHKSVKKCSVCKLNRPESMGTQDDIH